MIVDVRTYTLVPRKMAKYLELLETHALPVMTRHGLELMGYYVSQIGPLNQVVHLWRYDSLADMERKRAARDADLAWSEFLTLTEGMVLLQDDKVMRPTPFSPAHELPAKAQLAHQEERALENRGERSQVPLVGDDKATELTDDEAAA